MKKIKSKILLSVGTIATLATTGSIFLSCGSSKLVNSDQQKLDGITTDMVKAAITKALAPTTSNPTPDAPTNNEFTNLSINGLDDVTITIANWAKDIDLGSASFSVVQLVKGPAIEGGSKFGTITIFGFSSDQSKLDGITTDMVKVAITTALAPTTSNPVPEAPTNNKFSNLSINGLDDVSITIANWAKDLAQGVVSFSITSIDKGNAHVDGAQFGNISISGFKSTDQIALDGVTTNMVKVAITVVLSPTTQKQVPEAPTDNIFTGITINGLSNVSIKIANWEKHNNFGSLSFSIVSIAKEIAIVDGAKFGTISIAGFLQTPYTFSPIASVEANKVNCTIKTKEGKYLVGTAQGLWVSTDGTTFTRLTYGIQTNWNIQTIYQTLNGNIYVGTDVAGAYLSTNGGTSFTSLGGIGMKWNIQAIYQISGDIYVCTFANGLWVSFDGTIFTPISFDTGSANWNILSIYQTLDRDIYVGTYANGLWRSKDGSSFIRVTNGIQTNWNIQTIYQTSNRDIYIGTKGNGLWASLGGSGITFTPISVGTGSNVAINSMFQISNRDIFVAIASHGLWVLKNGGTTFTQVGGHLDPSWSIHSIYQPPNVDKLFVGTDANGLYESN